MDVIYKGVTYVSSLETKRHMKSTEQAFPHIHINNDGTQNSISGMTLRDYMATKILTGFLAGRSDYDNPSESNFVQASVNLADQLLKELAK